MRNVLIALLFTSSITTVSATTSIETVLLTPLQQEQSLNDDFQKPINDKAILEAIDEIEGQLNLIELDKQYNQSTLENINKQQVINEPLLNDVDTLFDDGFDDLDIDVELSDDIKEISDHDLLPFIENDNSINKHGKTNTPTNSDIKGVGVLGKEEFLINQLDNSELVDIEPELDLLLNKKIVPQEKIDDLYEK